MQTITDRTRVPFFNSNRVGTSGALGLAFALLSSACEEVEMNDAHGELGGETLGIGSTGSTGSTHGVDEAAAEDEPMFSLQDHSEPTAAGTRPCTNTNDCYQGCECSQGTCEPGLIFGPPPPVMTNNCHLAPTRACNWSSDCQAGCNCTAGVCKASEFGPFPPIMPKCQLPPPDTYETDDVWQDWSAYSGPQGHNFHSAADADWVAVYFGGAGKVRFWTTHLSEDADTKIEVYTYTANGKGPLVGSHDDIGGYYDPNKKSSRVDRMVPANSAYLVRVINKTPASNYATSYTYPTYTLKITYL